MALGWVTKQEEGSYQVAPPLCHLHYQRGEKKRGTPKDTESLGGVIPGKKKTVARESMNIRGGGCFNEWVHLKDPREKKL